jgi:thiamine kinase-like enzyme
VDVGKLGFPTTLEELDGAAIGSVLFRSGRISSPEGVRVTAVRPVQGGTAWATKMAILDLEGPEGTPTSTVVKLPIQGDIRNLLDGIGAYKREVIFYRQLASHCPTRVPVSYAAELDDESNDFLLLLEDLSGLDTPDQLVGFSVDQAKSALASLAKFHAWMWQNPRLVDFEHVFPPLDGARSKATYETFITYFEAVWPMARDLEVVTSDARTIGDQFRQIFPEFVKHLSYPRTLSHGELRADNFFLPKGGEMLMIDFQSLAQQAGMIDAAYLISQSIDESIRRGTDEDLVQFYHGQLELAGVEGYSLAQAWEQYRAAVAFMLMMPVLAFIQAEQSDARGKALMTEMLARASDTIASVGSVDLLLTPGAAAVAVA